ncbi:MAG TPA: serine/threonine protein kinase [Candidatus Melainabacteria bacterium]|nr:serine/threonine protein kinase [Candidatus Melainabacteria bacterium]HIN66802.1 serine/threonine protein kinase [Candidatus Obscuribacterales bacterium]
MSELEVVIEYRSTPQRVGLFIMGALMPLWAIVVPFCLGFFISMLLQAQAVPPVISAIVLSVLMAIPFVSIVLAAICEDDRLLVSKEGFSFPLLFLPMLKFRRERLWSDLKEARLLISDTQSKTKENLPQGKLNLHFNSGGHVDIPLKSLKRSDLERLLLSLEVWGAQCRRTPELIAFHDQLQNQNLGIDKLSYTQMWEEELSRRFSATAFVPLEPDRKLQDGRIKIVKQLAFGGLSAIYLAQLNEKEMVIVKEAVIPEGTEEKARDKAMELFAREAQFLIRLDHDQIAKVFDHFHEEGRHYLLLEYVRGQDLRQLVKQNGPQPTAHVVKWAHEIAGILKYLHEQAPPIIHRDLTPENIVLNENGSVKLIDFGAANEFVGTATGTLVGKQAYMAPEQLRGKASTLSDIYALGGTLHYLLTAKDPEPLSESSPKELRPDVPEELDQIVLKLTSMEEADRPQTALAIAEKFADLRMTIGSHADSSNGDNNNNNNNNNGHEPG